MSVTNINAQNHHQFNASLLHNYRITVKRQALYWRGAADFAVFDTANPGVSLGGGSCPALSAIPPHVVIDIGLNVAFTVQSLNGDIEVTW